MPRLPQFISDALDRVRARSRANRHLKDGNRAYQQRDFATAITAYREAVAIEPRRPVLRINLGLALYKNGEKTAGRAEWKVVLELTQGHKDSVMIAEQATILLRQFG